MILGLLVLVLQLLQHHHGGAVTHLTAGNVSVFDVYDGVLRVAGADVVDHDLALVAELRRNARGDLLKRFKASCFQNLPSRPRFLTFYLIIIPHFAENATIFSKYFLVS